MGGKSMSATTIPIRWPQSTLSVRPQPIELVRPELARVVEVETAPWLSGALEELRTLKEAGRNLPGFGDFRIAEETMDRVRQLLTVDAVGRLSRPNIIQFSGGGISLSWVTGNRELTFSVYPGDEEVTFMDSVGQNRIVEDGVVRARDRHGVAAVIQRFLR